jgi:hypothetical protein
MQRSADRLRQGYAPLSNQPEEEMGAALQRLNDQLGQARQAMASGNGSGQQQNGDALDAAERLRGRVASLDESLRRAGEARGGARGGATQGSVNGAWNSGNNSPLGRGSVSPVPVDGARPLGDPEQIFRQASRDMEQLRRAIQDDPEAKRQVDDLVRSMQNLDPKRFPGNPAMVDELAARVRTGVDRLELQLRHESPDNQPGQVHSDSAAPVPDGYQSSVADYFRRLSKNPSQ